MEQERWNWFAWGTALGVLIGVSVTATYSWSQLEDSRKELSQLRLEKREARTRFRMQYLHTQMELARTKVKLERLERGDQSHLQRINVNLNLDIR
jgi:hypothetical protein